MFERKELFAHFEMLIVSHALQCVNGHYCFMLSLVTVCYTVLVPVLDNHVSDGQPVSIKKLKRITVY